MLSEADIAAIMYAVSNLRVFDAQVCHDDNADTFTAPVVLWQQVVETLAELCSARNARFNRKAFLAEVANVRVRPRLEPEKKP